MALKLIIITGLMMLMLSSSAYAWLSPDYAYARDINVSENAGVNLNNYSVIFPLNHSGIDNLNCSDIVVANSSDEIISQFGLLNCNATHIMIDMKTDMLKNENQTFRVYFGNPARTFLNSSWNETKCNVYDGWEDGYTLWSGQTGDFAVDGGTSFAGSNSLERTSASAHKAIYRTDYNFTQGVHIELRSKRVDSASYGMNVFLRTSQGLDIGYNDGYFAYGDYGNTFRMYEMPAWGTTFSESLAQPTAGSWERVVAWANSTTLNGTVYTGTWTKVSTGQGIDLAWASGFAGIQNYGQSSLVDEFCAREFVLPEPTVHVGPRLTAPISINDLKVTIQSPENITYSGGIWFNVTVNDTASDCVVNWGINNYSLSNSSGNWNYYNDTLIDGSYNATFFCHNDVGGLYTNTSFFIVLLSSPNIRNWYIINETTGKYLFNFTGQGDLSMFNNFVCESDINGTNLGINTVFSNFLYGDGSNLTGIAMDTYNSSYDNIWKRANNDSLLRNNSHASLGFMSAPKWELENQFGGDSAYFYYWDNTFPTINAGNGATLFIFENAWGFVFTTNVYPMSGGVSDLGIVGNEWRNIETQDGYVSWSDHITEAGNSNTWVRATFRDADDTFRIYREDAYVLGMRIEMPLNVSYPVNVEGNITATGNMTSNNVFIPQYIFSHTNATIPVQDANNWTNVTFDQEVADISFGISHDATNSLNTTFTIMEDGIYEVDYDFDIEDDSVGASTVDVAGRLIFLNGTEVIGSVFETDITKNGVGAELSHDFLIRSSAGDVYIFQFVGSDADVQISTHGTYGDHPESATIVIKKISNI